MKIGDLKCGDRLICLRILHQLHPQVSYFYLTVTKVGSGCYISVISDNFERYVFSRLAIHEINGLSVILDNGGEIDERIDSFIFETLEDCKEFVEKYCKEKIKDYEQIIQTSKSW